MSDTKKALLVAALVTGIIASGAVAFVFLRDAFTGPGDTAPATAAPAAQEPRKDKEKARDKADDKALAKLEKELDRSYERVLALHREKKNFAKQQKEWLAGTRERCRGDDKCLRREYKERIDKLEDIAQRLEKAERR